MTIHPSLFPTLFAAVVSVPAAAILRRTVRKEYASLLPWLMPWGMLCALPALAFAILCLPPFADLADQINAEIAGTWFEILAGTAGVLPGLLWDDIDERLENNRKLPFRLPAAALRAAMLIALLVLILVPFGFLFNRTAPAQTRTAQPVKYESPAPQETITQAAQPVENESHAPQETAPNP